MSQLETGQVLKLRNFEHHFATGDRVGRLGFKAAKDRQYVVVLLGTEPRDGSKPLDPIKAMQDLGWRLEPPAPVQSDEEGGFAFGREEHDEKP